MASKASHREPPVAPTTPVTSSTRSRWLTLPPDLLHQACKRVGIMAISLAALWLVALVMDNAVAPLLGHEAMPGMGMPEHGNLISILGLASSLGMVLLARRLSAKPQALLNAASAFQMLTAALVALLTQLQPAVGTMRVSWLCLIILIHPAVVPTPPARTLFNSLVIATMDPIAYWAVGARTLAVQPDTFTLIWYFLPNYLAVGLAVIPSSIISGLGRQVNQARELGSYQLGDLIGRGGMGEVYRAHHRLLARPAAIKLIRPEALGMGNSDAAQAVIQRFRREAQAAALLRSPHTINLYDFGMTDEGTFYYVMELLEGFDLETLVKRFGPIDAGRTSYLIQHVCHSLGEAHARGLIHRDIKPSNIFTCRLGLSVDFIKVLDFGLVKNRSTAEGQTVLLTQPHMTTGTPAFMAPEMALGEPTIDSRVDIYALGCVAYWLLTGRLVFEADTPVKTMLQHIQAEPVPPSRVTEIEVPPEMDRIILQCLAKKPDERPRDAAALRCQLASLHVPEPWTRERADRWWETNAPAAAPVTELRPKTPVGEVRAAT